jgi:hypothetical protein
MIQLVDAAIVFTTKAAISMPLWMLTLADKAGARDEADGDDDDDDDGDFE